VLAGAHFSATRYALSIAREEEREKDSAAQEQLSLNTSEGEAHAKGA
jgi:hypothetical protein